jgi:hypothetical protein
MFRQIANHASSTAVEVKAHVQELLHHAALLAIEHGLELDIGDCGGSLRERAHHVQSRLAMVAML